MLNIWRLSKSFWGWGAIMPPPMTRQFTLSDFDFDLPTELIAQVPPEIRGQSRLLHVKSPQELIDQQFAEILSEFNRGDALVVNNTKVIPARVFARKSSGGRVELLIERVLSQHRCLAQIRASHKPKPGDSIALENASASLSIVEYQPPFVVLESSEPLLPLLDRAGQLPLPPYIERQPAATDRDRYQTVYAQHQGAVAAPTAGLHFTEAMIGQLRAKGVEFIELTLHVGAGTFQPVRTEQLEEHKMHAEWYSISNEAVDTLRSTKANGHQIFAVGTTSLRALESAAVFAQSTHETLLSAGSRETSIFITPGFEFKVVDRLITNFHLPKSTLMMLVSAFAGYETIRTAYAHAITNQYRFFSYGDAMLLYKQV